MWNTAIKQNQTLIGYFDFQLSAIFLESMISELPLKATLSNHRAGDILLNRRAPFVVEQGRAASSSSPLTSRNALFNNKMGDIFKTGLSVNVSSYKSSLERIIEKYSKLQYQEGGVEVDLCDTKPKTLERFMSLSKAEISKLDSKSLTDLREESIRAQDMTRDSQLDFTYEDSGSDETRVSTSLLSVREDAVSTNDSSSLTLSSWDESLRSGSETEVQPEDRDEELEMSLRSHGSSLVELYPGMIGRIGRAWRRQRVSEAADSVLRRYRKWRRQTGRSNLGNTFIVTLRHAVRIPENGSSRTPVEETRTRTSPVKRPFTGAEADPRSPLRMVNNVQQRSPWRTRREQHQPILVMDLSGPSETFMPRESSLNETFTVSEESRLGEQPSACTFSPSQPCHPAAKAPMGALAALRSRRLSFTSHSLQADLCSTYAPETVRERPDVYGSPVRPRMMTDLGRSPHGSPVRQKMMTDLSRSPHSSLVRQKMMTDLGRSPHGSPVRQKKMTDLNRFPHGSPVRQRMMTDLSRSPHGFPRSPKMYSGESFSREPSRPRLVSTPPHKPAVPLRMLHPQDAHHSLHPQLHSPQAAAAGGGRHGLRWSLSLDSSLPSIRVSCSLKKLDEDFLKLYHKFVCQSKSSFFNSNPCRLCARSSEAGRGPSSSSSSLAALALSPHRSLLRKRHRELDRDGHPQSKRYRDERCPSSPGSQRHGKEMLRRRLSPPECGLSYSARKPAMFQRFSTQQQRSADADQEAWMSRRSRESAAELSGMGRSLESRGFSPRKW